MRRLFTATFAAALLTLGVGSAQAVSWPPGNGTCAITDTLVYVRYVQDASLTPCYVATLDTVWGVGGIITGFDTFPSGYGFYIQNNATGANGAPFTGVDIFTSGENMVATKGLALGDSVWVYWSRKQEFQGGTELMAPNLSTSTGNMIVNKISSGHPLPAFHVGTVNELREPSSNPTGEQWEGHLVRVNGPMRVVRTSLTGGMTFSSFKVVDEAVCPSGSPGPCDSMVVDGSTLSFTAYPPPAIGTIVDQVQGIYEQRTAGYRIQLRDGNDIVVATPPNVSDAYPVADDTLRVLFDRNVTQASAENTANYSLGSFTSPVSATQVAGNAVHLAINNGLADGDNESVTVNGIVGAANGLAMTTPQVRNFYNGVMPIALIQAPDPAALGGACEDRSLYAGTGSTAGQRLTFRGVATGVIGNLYYMADLSSDKPGPRSGLVVFAPLAPLQVGRQYLFAGAVQEFFNETEGVNNVYLRDEGVARTQYPQDNPAVINIADLADSTCDATQTLNTGEDWETSLVRLHGVKVVSEQGPGISFRIAGPEPTYADTMDVTLSSNIAWTFDADSLHTLDVTGILRWSFGRFRVAPRGDADIIDYNQLVGAPQGPVRDLSFAVSNPSSRPVLTFTLPAAADVEIGVYDIVGRQVAVVARGRMPAGTYSREWDGRDARGQLTGAGMYFYKLKAGDRVLTQRGVRLN
jgi:hypothetical protein